MNDPSEPLHFVPAGWPTVIPRIVTHGAVELAAFVRRVFGATGEDREARPTELCIGSSVILVSDAGERRPMSAFLYVYVPDTDAAYQRALAAGARSIEEPRDTPYGDRRSMIEDEWGNTWQIATYRGTRES